eukprot:TRINITY_DN6186_c0_g1_i1.p1 TRINITY_DN6186_c0_g1~~TRINITY_DN6186_c0_g1_i1.p1  ORF type:complete len:542 (-),score=66.17 TRINITY_DN6186_c0_g1_i1:227-1852(-)
MGDEHNEYLSLYLQRMQQLRLLRWPATDSFSGVTSSSEGRSRRALLVDNEQQKCSLSGVYAIDPLLPAYMRLQVSPLRRLYSWAVPTEEALAAIAAAAPNGLVEMGAGTGYWAMLLRQRGVAVAAYDRRPMDDNRTNGHHALPNMDALPDIPHKAQATGEQEPESGGTTMMMDGESTEQVPCVHPPAFTHVEGGAARDGFLNCSSCCAQLALFLCWPPRENEAREEGVEFDVAFMALESLQRFAGRVVIYVGEVPADLGQRSDLVDEWGNQTCKPREGEQEDEKESATGGTLFHEMLLSGWVLARRLSLPQWPGASDCLTIWVRKGTEEESPSLGALSSPTQLLSGGNASAAEVKHLMGSKEQSPFGVEVKRTYGVARLRPRESGVSGRGVCVQQDGVGVLGPCPRMDLSAQQSSFAPRRNKAASTDYAIMSNCESPTGVRADVPSEREGSSNTAREDPSLLGLRGALVRRYEQCWEEYVVSRVMQRALLKEQNGTKEEPRGQSLPKLKGLERDVIRKWFGKISFSQRLRIAPLLWIRGML